MSRDQNNPSGQSHDCYLGSVSPCLITPTDFDARVYALVSSTKIKLIVIIERGETDGPGLKKVGETTINIRVSQLCRTLYGLYSQTIANPLFSCQIETPKFNKKIGGIHRR